MSLLSKTHSGRRSESLESVLQSKILNWLKSKGIYCIKSVSSNRAGVPDILCCIKGKFVAIECKSKYGVVSKLQAHNIKLISMNKGKAIVVNTWDNFLEQIKQFI